MGRCLLSCQPSTGVSALCFVYSSRAGISCSARLFVGEPVVIFFIFCDHFLNFETDIRFIAFESVFQNFDFDFRIIVSYRILFN